ncbi:GPO family capsid scaffolding protein [Escherichia coli]|uniref:GPO family capsid scaffolding protein n=1 Tax=Escherichia coli TaxID=562 RepID=UPI000BE5F887|nr:GPO family capsid scaffolding protein [Escherichia coli]
MADKKPERKKFRVAVSGPTVDGREISGDMLRTAATDYSQEVYGARVNVEHCLSFFPGVLDAMGDVVSLSAEDITDGPLAGRTALYAEIEPTERMKKLLDEGKKVYSSIELHPQFALNGNAYVVGLAMTDTPASLGTERLQFAAQQRADVMTFNNQQCEPPLFTDAIEAEIITLNQRQNDEGVQWFARVMNLISGGRKTDSEQFAQMRDVVERVASAHADLLDRFNAQERQRDEDRAQITRLTSELAALREQLQTQDGDPCQRFSATGSDARHHAATTGNSIAWQPADF